MLICQLSRYSLTKLFQMRLKTTEHHWSRGWEKTERTVWPAPRVWEMVGATAGVRAGERRACAELIAVLKPPPGS